MNSKLIPARTIVILISGKAGTGKSTLAKLLLTKLTEKGLETGILPLATGVKSMAKLLGWKGDKTGKGRKLLQDIGNVGREFDENTWVKIAYEQLGSSMENAGVHCIISDDWRFPNEYDFLQGTDLYQVVRIRIEAPDRELLKGTSLYDDYSETSLPSAVPGDGYYDIYVYNQQDMPQLDVNADTVVQYILNNSKFW